MHTKLTVTMFLVFFSNFVFSDSFVPLGDLPGGDFHSEANVLSSNGKVVAGFGSNPTSLSIKNLAIWEDRKLIDMGALPSKYDAFATGISQDGKVIVGVSGNEGFVWNKANGMQTIGHGRADAVSPDGLFVVGEKDHAATLWSTEGLVVIKQMKPKGHMASSASCVTNSSDFICVNATQKGFLWRGDKYDQIIQDGIFLNSSDNKKYFVGFSRNRQKRGFPTEGVFWSEETGVVYIAGIKETTPIITTAKAVSENGEYIVGQTSRVKPNTNSITTPFVWIRSKNKIIDLEEYFKNNSILPKGWVLYGVNDISADGKIIIGSGRNPDGNTEAWMATIESIN